MDEEEAILKQGKRAVAQPGEQILTVGGGEDVLQGVGLAVLTDAGCGGQGVDVVVA